MLQRQASQDAPTSTPPTPIREQSASLALNAVSYSAPHGPISTSTPHWLVSGISFAIQPGEIVALVGPNGAGKTTLLRLMAGLVQPSSGDLYLNGRPLKQLSSSERAKSIAYVGQSEDPDARLLVEHYVGLGSLPHQRSLSGTCHCGRVPKALSAVGLEAFAKRRMGQLSGGERQKAKIARALCQEPSLLILDEPTNHLDPYARGELLSFVASMGISVVAALHDLTLIDAFADKVAVITGGQLAAFGAPDEVLTTTTTREVFHVEMHRFTHPSDDRTLPALDVPIDRA